jgi:hypothetical protein
VLVSLILSQHSNIATVPFPVSRSLLITAEAFPNAVQLLRSLDLVITGPRMCAQVRNLPKAEAEGSSPSSVAICCGALFTSDCPSIHDVVCIRNYISWLLFRAPFSRYTIYLPPCPSASQSSLSHVSPLH